MKGARLDAGYEPGRCRKCSGLGIDTKYDAAADRLANRCKHCGYEWTDAPMDAPEREGAAGLRFGVDRRV